MTEIQIPLDVIKSMLGYVKTAQAVLVEKSKQEAEFNKVAEAAVGVLVDAGLLDAGLRDQRIALYRDTPVQVLSDLQKVAKKVEAQKLGAPTAEKQASDGKSLDEMSADDAYVSILTGGQAE